MLARDGVSVLHGHRLVLAASSSYFSSLFGPVWSGR